MDHSSSKIPLDLKPLVIIAIPVYNGSKYILEALESINNQTYENFECHIINNASTDETEQLVKDFIKGNNRFRLHTYPEFVDLISNWNRTVNHIPPEAKYFKIVPADDYLFPESLETMVNLMEKYTNAGIGSSYRLDGTKVDCYGIDYFKGECQIGKDILLDQLMEKAEITGSATQLMFRIEHLRKLSSYPAIFVKEAYHTDTRLAYEVLFISDLVFSFKVLNYTRRHNKAQTLTTVKKFSTPLQHKESTLFRFKDYYPELERKYSEVRRDYAYFLFKKIIFNDKECLKWHSRFLIRKIKLSEYIAGIFLRNKISLKVARYITAKST